MAILDIVKMGHPALRVPAPPVDDPQAPAIRQLAADMVETMHAAPGIGLAATQVGVALRLVVFYLPEGRDERGRGVPLTILANPVIEPLDNDKALGWEGCLSVPDWRGEVPRHTRIRYSGWTPDGERIERVAEGMHARVVQHECDHLDGLLYPQRMEDMSRLVHTSEWAAFMEREA